jgi:protein tyrosine phosphatase (PTP) superfamily phosphohydrolase (DUF442 family)
MAAVVPVESIYRYLALADDLATSGQPTTEELAALAARGVAVIINLGLHNAPYSLPDERAQVESLGMAYEHIPVEWEYPRAVDYAAFVRAMRRHAGQRLLVHCSCNYRASAFVALYRILELDWPRDTAFAAMYRGWQPDATWTAFMETTLAQPPSPTA